MEYSTLGRTGLRVSRLSLGAMTFGAGSGIWGDIAGLDSDQATRLVAMAVERGVNLIDTADAYSQGRSEEVVGQVLNALGLDESRMLVATKVRLRTGPGHNEVGLGRSHIMRSVETSLKRIGRDHIDLFQLHDRDALVPLDETLRVLDDLVTQGKVRHIGVCNFSAADLERAFGITSRTDRVHVASNQVHYSLTSRDIEHEIMPVAAANRMGLLVWSPLAGGYLSGKYAGSGEGAGRRTKLDFPPVDTVRAEPILAVLREVAGCAGMDTRASADHVGNRRSPYARATRGQPRCNASMTGIASPDDWQGVGNFACANHSQASSRGFGTHSKAISMTSERCRHTG